MFRPVFIAIALAFSLHTPSSSQDEGIRPTHISLQNTVTSNEQTQAPSMQDSDSKIEKKGKLTPKAGDLYGDKVRQMSDEEVREEAERRMAYLRNTIPSFRWQINDDKPTFHPHGVYLLSGAVGSLKSGKILAIDAGYLNATNEVLYMEVHSIARRYSYSSKTGRFSYTLIVDAGDYRLVKCELKDDEKEESCHLLLVSRILTYFHEQRKGEIVTSASHVLLLKAKFKNEPSVATLNKIMEEDARMPVVGESATQLKIHPYGVQLFFGNIADDSYVYMISPEAVNASKEAQALKTFKKDSWTGFLTDDTDFEYKVRKEIPGGFYLIYCTDHPIGASGTFDEYILLKRAKWRYYEDETPKDIEVLLRLGDSHEEPSDEIIASAIKSCGLFIDKSQDQKTK